MKKINVLIFLLLICFWVGIVNCLGQAENLINSQTPSGRWYMQDFKDSAHITIVYLHGSGQRGNTEADLQKIKSTPFFTKFYSDNKGCFNFFFPQQKTSFSGWENKINGVTSGADFVLFLKQTYKIDKIIVTGHSAGATWETAAYLQGEIDGFIPVAGRALSYQKVKTLHSNGVKVNAWHGENDTAIPNNFAAGSQAVNWYIQGGGVPVWNVLPGIGHASDVIAYDKTSGLKTWILSLYE